MLLSMLADNGIKNTPVLANAQYRLFEGYIKTYILRNMDALFKLYILVFGWSATDGKSFRQSRAC